ncbi:helix-turn-helix transcriptional regulator [Veillonella sp.]|uniref:helix-turn-helix domain-containing protein n=1 Tax=Veillonella sp. TaxID=1926307 RepID=UPI0025E8F391|nr:helix-turn-helix transcriptional regulator [Veillonella sp.]
MHIGDLIKKYRTEHNLTQKQMGQLLGFTKAYISMLELNKNSRSGKPIAPSTTVLKAVADLYEISIDDLLTLLDGDQLIDLAPNKDSEKGYYDDLEVAELAEEARINPDIRILFSATKGISKESLQKTIDFVKFLKSQEHNDSDFSE